MTVVLGAYAARSCPVKTQNAFDPRLVGMGSESDESTTELFEGGLVHERQVLDQWAELPGVVDLRPLRDHPSRRPVEACLAEAGAGAAVIIGGCLPVDVGGHRAGAPDVLVRGADRQDGRPGYHPVEIKWHKIVEPDRPGHPDRPGRTTRHSTLANPEPERAELRQGFGARIDSREGDFLQLAHYVRMLQALGLSAAGPPLGGVVGTDDHEDGPLLVWVDLAEPLVRTFSRSDPEGWRRRTLLERYDHEHGFRVDIAATALRQTGHSELDPPLLVRPIVHDECARCLWWEYCRPQLDSDDVSLRINKGPLDAREIVTLRRFGVDTITDLADADLDGLCERYLPEVRHRSGAESRLRVAGRRAQMLVAGTSLERETVGPIEVPAAELEVDFDVETSVDGRVYLWGFLVDEGRSPPTKHQFSRFADLDGDAELDLAREALTWLRGLVERARHVRVYHYSSYEVAVLRGLADRSGDPLVQWAADYAEQQFVDLLEVVKRHYFGVAGLGLKSIARQAGFAWRDDDPGGLNSQRWFAEAVHAETDDQRRLARRRVLEYNEDDVIATNRVRGWLRAQ